MPARERAVSGEHWAEEVSVMASPHDPEIAEWMGMDTDREAAILAASGTAAAA